MLACVAPRAWNSDWALSSHLMQGRAERPPPGKGSEPGAHPETRNGRRELCGSRQRGTEHLGRSKHTMGAPSQSTYRGIKCIGASCQLATAGTANLGDQQAAAGPVGASQSLLCRGKRGGKPPSHQCEPSPLRDTPRLRRPREGKPHLISRAPEPYFKPGFDAVLATRVTTTVELGSNSAGQPTWGE